MTMVILLVLALLLVACDTSDPIGPQIRVTGNSGPVTVVVPTGSGSAGSTAPCGAVGVSQKDTAQPTASPAPNCSTTTDDHSGTLP